MRRSFGLGVFCIPIPLQILILLLGSHMEALVRRCSVKKVFLEILQNSQENTCARVSFLIKLQASGSYPFKVLPIPFPLFLIFFQLVVRQSQQWQFLHHFTFLKSHSHLLKKIYIYIYIFVYLPHWKPFTNDEKGFLFHLKSSFCSQDI